MKAMYSLRQAAELLHTTPQALQALAERRLGQARDLLSADEVSLLRGDDVLPRTTARRHRRPTPDGQTSLPLEGVASPRPPLGVRAAEAEAHFERGLQLEEAHPTQALQAYTEAVAANPFHADAHVNLGRLLHQRGWLGEAHAHYVAALVANPANPIAAFNLAVVQEDQGQVDAAIATYREALELDPACVDAYFNLSRLYERKGERMAALRTLKDYRRLSGAAR